MTPVRKIRRRAFHAWFRLSRSLTLGVRGLVENEAGEVLLVRHTYVDGLYLPGGGVERAETADTALERELIEEAGVKLVEQPVLHGIYSNHTAFPNDHVLLYRILAWEAVPATSTGEIAEIVWTDPVQLPGDVTPGTARRLAEFYRGAPRSSTW